MNFEIQCVDSCRFFDNFFSVSRDVFKSPLSDSLCDLLLTAKLLHKWAPKIFIDPCSLFISRCSAFMSSVWASWRAWWPHFWPLDSPHMTLNACQHAKWYHYTVTGPDSAERVPLVKVSRMGHLHWHFQVFIFMTGVFVSSWMGGAALSLGEWIIKKLPLIKHIYSAAKQARQ